MESLVLFDVLPDLLHNFSPWKFSESQEVGQSRRQKLDGREARALAVARTAVSHLLGWEYRPQYCKATLRRVLRTRLGLAGGKGRFPLSSTSASPLVFPSTLGLFG
eukprot:scaffold1883_cov396-Prasinococcus_capsulatus_cf.AAC.9